MKTTPDWIAIEGDFRVGSKSLRLMASEHGTSEGTIRRKAKKEGWVRDPTGTKRHMVAARLAGVTQGSTQCVMRQIEDEATQDVRDMRDGLTVYRNILTGMVVASEAITDPRDAKVVAEATEKAINGIRTIRGLDDPSKAEFEDIDAEIEAKLTQLESQKKARAFEAAG